MPYISLVALSKHEKVSGMDKEQVKKFLELLNYQREKSHAQQRARF